MNKPNITTHKLVWRGILLVVRHRADYLWPGTSHVEVYVVRPKRAVIPITETGYRSHFICSAALASAGGSVAFISTWLDREAKSKDWIARELREAQGDLFY